MSNGEKHFAELVSRYEQLQHSRGLSDAELKRVSDWMSDIIAVMSKHSEQSVNDFGPRWENIQDATIEMFRWFVDFETRVRNDDLSSGESHDQR